MGGSWLGSFLVLFRLGCWFLPWCVGFIAGFSGLGLSVVIEFGDWLCLEVLWCGQGRFGCAWVVCGYGSGGFGGFGFLVVLFLVFWFWVIGCFGWLTGSGFGWVACRFTLCGCLPPVWIWWF